MPQLAYVPTDNRLIASLPARERRRMLAGCQQIEFGGADVLCKPGKRINHVFFPLDGCISVLTPAIDGASLDTALIGDEGMLGASLMLGLTIAPLRAQVQQSGHAWRMETEAFQRELECSLALRQILNRYLYVTLIQFAQTAVCTRFHLVEARLARWLLMSRDRTHAEDFAITHERLADSLGVRRVGITRAANSLQQRMLIRYRRGKLQILDGNGLEAVACGCYAADKEIYRRHMS